jgi:hypothetical protein
LLKVKVENYPAAKNTVFQALGAIGPKATKSIPMLVDAVETENNVHAALALWNITGDKRRTMRCLIGAVERGSTIRTAANKTRLFQVYGPDLMDQMYGDPEWDAIIKAQQDHEDALACLGEMGREGREAVPAVTKEFRAARKERNNRFHAAETLVKLGEVSDELFNFLADVVEEEEAGIYVDIACRLLAEMEPRASAAIPVLKAALKDDDERIVKAAAKALKEIEGRTDRCRK